MVPRPTAFALLEATIERRIVKKYNVPLRATHFLVVEGYDPRIHALYFCPQLYRFDSDKKLVPLQGEEIGKVIAQSLEGGVSERRPWYQPSERFPDEPVINAAIQNEFDTVVVEMPSTRNVLTKPKPIEKQ